MNLSRLLLISTSFIAYAIGAYAQYDTISLVEPLKVKPDPKIWWINTQNDSVYCGSLGIYAPDLKLYQTLYKDSIFHNIGIRSFDTNLSVFDGLDSISYGTLVSIVNARNESFKWKYNYYESCQKMGSLVYAKHDLERFGDNIKRAYSLLYTGVDKWQDKGNHRFVEWSLNDSFYTGIYHLKVAESFHRILDSISSELSEVSSEWPKFAIDLMVAAYDSLDKFSKLFESQVKTSSKELGPMVILMKRFESTTIPPILWEKNGSQSFAASIVRAADSLSHLRPPESNVSLVFASSYRSKPFVKAKSAIGSKSGRRIKVKSRAL